MFTHTYAHHINQGIIKVIIVINWYIIFFMQTWDVHNFTVETKFSEMIVHKYVYYIDSINSHSANTFLKQNQPGTEIRVYLWARCAGFTRQTYQIENYVLESPLWFSPLLIAYWQRGFFQFEQKFRPWISPRPCCTYVRIFLLLSLLCCVFSSFASVTRAIVRDRFHRLWCEIPEKITLICEQRLSLCVLSVRDKGSCVAFVRCHSSFY